MRAVKILISKLFENLPSVHQARKNSLSFAVESLCSGGKLSLTSLGRSATSQTTVKHNIKRIDRLLGNPKVAKELPQFCGALVKSLIPPNSSPIFLVDWTLIGKDHCALFASVPYRGRAVTMYFEVHSISHLANREVEYTFLDTINQLLPSGVKPTLITDAAYLHPWFRKVIELEWYFVGRLNPRMRVFTKDGQQTSVRQLECSAKKKALDLGECRLTISNPLIYRVIQGAKLKRNPKRRLQPRPFSGPGRGSHSARRRAFTPWVLGTNHKRFSAQEVMSLYAMRMSIEEQFRDFKNMRFGWALREARTKSAKRYSVLLLIGSIAHFVMLMIGAIAEKKDIHRSFSSRSNSKQRVLSLFFLAKELLRFNYTFKINLNDIKSTLGDVSGYFIIKIKTGDT